MKAVHILSHNAVLVKDDTGRKCIVTGRGIGFKKEVGDRISQQLIQNKFIEEVHFKTRKVIYN